MAASEEWARDYKKRGFNMLAAGPDQAPLAEGMRSILASVADT
jgi:2-keto-3-deoxy-L-rhamnonate aldolase RhmA